MKRKISLTSAIAILSAAIFALTPKAYITNYGDNFISVIDIQKNQKITDITTGKKTHGVTISPDGIWMSVSNEGENSDSNMSAADNLVKQTEDVGRQPHPLSFSLDGKYAVVSNTSSNEACIIDIEKWQVIATLPVGKNPKRLWVANIK